jgi:hypothetical protein
MKFFIFSISATVILYSMVLVTLSGKAAILISDKINMHRQALVK